MTWFKLDDGFHSHPKILAAGNAAAGLFCRFGSYCSQHSTDGFVPAMIVKSYGKPSEVKALVGLELIEEVGGGYVIPDFLDFNPSAVDTATKRAARAEAGRRGGIASGKSRKPQPNGEANASASLEAKLNPVPSRPVPNTLTSSSVSTVVAPNTDDDNADYESVLDRVADAKMAGRRIDNPKAYRHATRLNTHLEDGDWIRAELAQGTDVEHVALLVLGYGTEAAKEREAERWRCDDDCAECDGSGWIRVPQGLAPCPGR